MPTNKKMKFDHFEPPKEVTLSKTFMVQHRCRHCGSEPKRFGTFFDKRALNNQQEMKVYFDYWHRWEDFRTEIYRWSFQRVPRISDFRFQEDLGLSFLSVPKKSFRQKVERKFELLEGMFCQCGETFWESKKTKNNVRPEITQRSARNVYPMKKEKIRK